MGEKEKEKEKKDKEKKKKEKKEKEKATVRSAPDGSDNDEIQRDTLLTDESSVMSSSESCLIGIRYARLFFVQPTRYARVGS